MNVFELFAKLSLDTSEYDKGLDGAESKASKFGSAVKTAGGVAAGALAATTAATVAGAKAFVDSVSSVAQYGDNIDKMSQKMNITAEAYQEWDFVMQHCGTSIEALKPAMKTLATQATTNAEIFEELGISQEALANMSQEDLFSATIASLQSMEDETQRTYLAGKLLGRGATELGALWNMTAEETEAMKQQVHELGGVLSDSAVKDAAQFQDSLQNMQTSFAGVKNSMLSDFLPAFSTTMDGLSLIFSGSDVEGGLASIESGVSDLADSLVAKAPEIMQIGGTILKALVSSITSNLPVLLETAVPIMTEIATGIVENLPAIVEAGVSLVGSIVDAIAENLPMLLSAAQQIILSLANSIAKNAPKIIPTIVNLVLTIAKALTDPKFLVPLLNAGIQIVLGLIQGLVTAIPMIIEQLPLIIDNICQFLIEALPLILDAGIQLFMSLIDAIPVILEALMVALPQIIDTIVQLVIQGLPLLLQGAIQLLMAIIQAIPTIIVALVQNIPSIVTSIITTLLNNIPALIKGAIELLMGIITAIPTIIVELGKNLPAIIEAIVKGLSDGIGQIASVGGDLIRGLWNGISDMASWIGEKIKGFGEGVVNGLKSFFGIASPSKLFENVIGKNLALGIGEGFSDEMSNVISDMEEDADKAVKGVSDAFSKPVGGITIGDANIATYQNPKEAENRKNLLSELEMVIDKKFSTIEISAPIYIGGKKIDQQIVTANARNTWVSGGR